MSTHGSFIICRDGICKEMVIRHDAYPAGAGLDVIDLIQTADLNEIPEYKPVWDSYMEEESRLGKYRQECKDEALALFSKWFYAVGLRREPR